MRRWLAQQTEMNLKFPHLHQREHRGSGSRGVDAKLLVFLQAIIYYSFDVKILHEARVLRNVITNILRS